MFGNFMSWGRIKWILTLSGVVWRPDIFLRKYENFIDENRAFVMGNLQLIKKPNLWIECLDEEEGSVVFIQILNLKLIFKLR